MDRAFVSFASQLMVSRFYNKVQDIEDFFSFSLAIFSLKFQGHTIKDFTSLN